MNAEKMRVRVAEAMGWKWFPSYNKRKQANFLVPPKGRAVTVWRDGGFGGGDNLPNYPADLNACHEMEKALTANQRFEYVHTHLEKIIQRDLGTIADWYWNIHATAAQRCEAFLKCKGLWEEGE